jgi:hypothetical protein
MSLVLVELSVTADRFDPDIITKHLSIMPTKKWLTGEKIVDDIDSKYKIRDSYWKYSCWEYSVGYKETYNVEELLQEIYEVIQPKAEVLRDLVEKMSLDVTLSIVIELKDGNRPSLHFEKKIIDFLHTIHAEIDVDLYVM